MDDSVADREVDAEEAGEELAHEDLPVSRARGTEVADILSRMHPAIARALPQHSRMAG